MNSVVRVAIGNKSFTIMVLETGKPIHGVELTEAQAADIYAQLKMYLPSYALNREPFSSDRLEEDSNASHS